MAEEGVGMDGAARSAGGGKAIEEGVEDLAGAVQIAVVGDLKAGDGGRVAPHGLPFLEGLPFYESANETADEHAGRTAIAQGEFHAYCAVGYGLPGSHFAPEARGVRAEFGEAIFEFLDAGGLIEVLHIPESVAEIISGVEIGYPPPPPIVLFS